MPEVRADVTHNDTTTLVTPGRSGETKIPAQYQVCRRQTWYWAGMTTYRKRLWKLWRTPLEECSYALA
jgi:hypothetical protein